jgi:hypothetical protein
VVPPSYANNFQTVEKSRNRKIALQFCFLRWLHLQISVTYEKYAPSFAALANPFALRHFP